MKLDDKTIAVIGLGYVGLPLAMEFARTRPVVGFDIRRERIDELLAGRDSTLEVDPEDLRQAGKLELTDDPEALRRCGIFIVTVPTPIDKANRPDLKPLIAATETVGKTLRQGGVVIYESTVYPGCTREVCVPILERLSGLKLNEGFYVGYSPERANPGDRQHRLATITKVTSGSTPEAADAIDALYGSIVLAGTHKATSIEVAEAAKVIENTQRDLNIALMNELAIIFNRLGIDTLEVLAAAQTKWNFLPFRPGLVGGHCIGVDPYYLTHMAEKLGYHPEVILAGRRVNDSMGHFVGQAAVKQLIAAGKNVAQSRVLVLGVTFKPNVSDIRNSRVREVACELLDYGVEVVLCDPLADPEQVEREYGLPLTGFQTIHNVDGVIAAVGHREYRELPLEQLRGLCRGNPMLVDVQAIYEREAAEQAGFSYWRL